MVKKELTPKEKREKEAVELQRKAHALLKQRATALRKGETVKAQNLMNEANELQAKAKQLRKQN